MKKLMLALLLAVPMFAEVNWGTQTQGTVTLTASKIVWTADAIPTNPHTFVYLLFVTSDEKCGMYQLSISYRTSEGTTTQKKDVHAVHYGELGHAGDDKDKQKPIHTGFTLPVDAEVLAISITTVQTTNLEILNFR